MKISNLFLFVVLTTICCANVAANIIQKNVRYKNGILYENEWVCGGIHVRGIDDTLYFDGLERSKVDETFSSKIDTQILSFKIKGIIHMVFFQEMGIKGGDFSDITQGNSKLAQDLKELFCVDFNKSDETAQEKLDQFCDKWNLEKIEINQAHTFKL